MRQALSELDGAAAKKELDDIGVLKLALPDGEVDLTAEELLIDTAQKEGFTSISDRGLTVVLDTTLNDQLIEEGFVREIVSKLQSMRKDAGFNVVDHIEVYHQGSQKIARCCGITNSPSSPTCWERPATRTAGRLHRPVGHQRRDHHFRREEAVRHRLHRTKKGPSPGTALFLARRRGGWSCAFLKKRKAAKKFSWQRPDGKKGRVYLSF